MHALQVRVRIANGETRCFALSILFREKARKDTTEFEIDAERPEREFQLKPLQDRIVLMRDQDVDSKLFDPPVWIGTKANGVSLFRDQIPLESRVNPFRHFHERRMRASRALHT